MQKYARETWVGVFVCIGLLCVAYLTVKLGKMEVFSRTGYTLTARFFSVSGLRVGADVEMAGVPVGKVTAIDFDVDNFSATVSLAIPSAVRLTADAIASIKTSGLIGDKYIRISQGGAPELLQNGDEIEETESAIDLEAAISKYVFGGVK